MYESLNHLQRKVSNRVQGACGALLAWRRTMVGQCGSEHACWIWIPWETFGEELNRKYFLQESWGDWELIYASDVQYMHMVSWLSWLRNQSWWRLCFWRKQSSWKYLIQDDQASRVVLVGSTTVEGVVSEAIMHGTAQLIWLEDNKVIKTKEIFHHLLRDEPWDIGCVSQQVRMTQNQ